MDSRGLFADVKHLQPFSQNPSTPTVGKEFQIGLYDPTEAVRDAIL